ncbi:MAG: hypothetical protein ACYDCI_07870 [Candidatus Limnocylindrales bacterium]
MRSWSGIVAILAVSAVAGCGGPGAPSVGASPLPSATALASAAPPTSPVSGIITNVRSAGLDKVLGFTIRTTSGDLVTFVVGRLDDPATFPPGHLAEHQASLQPVTVYFTVVAGQLVVYHLADG